MRLRRRSKVLLVTGASGFLGRHLTRCPAAERWQLIAPSSRSMDITDRTRTIETIGDWEPHAVIHLASRRGDRTNIVTGSRNVADAAAAIGARLVHVSSDAVFAGRPRPYTEVDVADPVTVYGVAKRDAETAVAESAPGAAIVRTSLLYGTDRSSPFQQEVAADLRRGGGSMTIFTDEFRCPAHADDVATALLSIADRPEIAGVINVAGPERVSRLEFALACARAAGYPDGRFRTATIDETERVRPADVALDCSTAERLGLGCRRLADALG